LIVNENNLHKFIGEENVVRILQKKNFKKRPKISKKYQKIALFSLFQGGGGQREKDRKMEKGRKIAPFSLYLLYLYHV